MNGLYSTAAGLAAGIMASLSIMLYRKRRQILESRHRERLRGLARTRDMSLLDGALPRHLYERAHDLGISGGYRVRHAMVGRDDRGSYYFAQRTSGKTTKQMLLFDANKDTRIDGFSLAPRRRSDLVSQWRRLAGRIFGRPYNDPVTIELGWKCRPVELLQEGLLERATQTMRAVADACHRCTSTALGIHVDGKRIAIYAEKGLDLRELNEFMNQALELRAAALDVLLDMRHLGSASGAVRPISEAIADVASSTMPGNSKGSSINRRRLVTKQNSGAWSMPMDLPVQSVGKPATSALNLREAEEVVIFTSKGVPLD